MYSSYELYICIYTSTLMLYDQAYVRHRRCSLRTMDPDKIMRVRVCMRMCETEVAD